MHIPDGLMHPAVLSAGFALSFVFLWLAARTAKGKIDEAKVPVLALFAAGIFVAQMLNFPIGVGVTGHVLGAALVTSLFGPWISVIIMTTVLAIQCLLFGDGGITAFGLNVLNMAVIASFVAWVPVHLLPGRKAGAAIGVWLSVFLAAGACALELSVSNAIDPNYGISAALAVPAMLGYHALIGAGDAIITIAVLSYLRAVAPKLMISGKAIKAAGAGGAEQ